MSDPEMRPPEDGDGFLFYILTLALALFMVLGVLFLAIRDLH